MEYGGTVERSEARSAGGRWRVAVAVISMVAASLVVAVGGIGIDPASAATTTTSFGMTTFRGSAVDPVTGRVFVAGDDQVKVFNPDGTLHKTVAKVYGAGAPFVSGGDLWVPETTAGAIARINIATSTLTQTFTAGTPVHGSLVVHNGLIWFSTPSSGISSYAQLATLDPGTGTVVLRGGSFYSAFLRTIPGSSDRLLVGEPGSSPFSVYLVDTTGPTITVLDDVPHGVGSNLRDLAVSADGQRMVTASGAPYLFPEFGISSMDPTGVGYPATHYPHGVAYSPANGGIYAGSVASNRQIYVWGDGRPVTAALLATDAEILSSSVELAGDGSRAYVVVEGSSGTLKLQTFGLAAGIASVLPAQSVQGVPTVVKVTGENLGGVTAATVGGVAAGVTVVSPTEVRVDVPTTVPVGSHPLVLATVLGSPSVPFTVVPNIGATLSGTVRSGSDPVAGVELSLTGGGLAGPVTTTSDATGAYSFSGVPFGTTYQLAVHDPSGAHPDQNISGLTLTPNDTTTVDVDLQVPPTPSGASLARVELPPGDVRDVEFDPGTGRAFVSVGDEVVVFDRDGVLLSRIHDQFGADGLALGGGSVWVNARSVGRITRIDPATASVTGSWPTTTPTTGGLAYAAGKLHFTDGNDQWVSLARLDPATGAVQKTGGSWYVPRFTNVLGAGDQVLLYEQGLSSNSVAHLDTGVAPPATINSSWTSGGADWVASADRDAVWSSSGVEHRLTTLAETGVRYPLNGGNAVAYSPAMGGLVATGRTVSRAGVPAASHVLDDTPATRALALDSTGDRAFLVSAQTFVVWSLKPVLQSAGLTPVRTPGPLVLTGSGLGETTQVTIDGLDVPFTVDDAGHLTVDVQDIPAGPHEVRVVTPWGTSDPLTVPTKPVRSTVGDYDGNGTTDIAVFRPSTGTWFVRGGPTTQWGTNGDIPVPADYDGNGTTDIAVFRPSTGTWFVQGGPTTHWGTNGDIPVPADYDGNGSAEIAVFRPSTGAWYIQAGPAVHWGTNGDIPVPADYDGDGAVDVAVFRPSLGLWFIQGGPTVAFGTDGDVPVPGDYQDGDGAAEIAVFRPSAGIWLHVLGAMYPWGVDGDIAVPGDYNGDGYTEIGVFRPSSGTWFPESMVIIPWGTTGDIPAL